MGTTRLTLEKVGREIDAHVPVPLAAPAADGLGDAGDVELLDALEDALAGAEADDDGGHAEEEGLDPPLHELALEVVAVAVAADLGRGLELHPADGLARA